MAFRGDGDEGVTSGVGFGEGEALALVPWRACLRGVGEGLGVDCAPEMTGTATSATMLIASRHQARGLAV